MLMLTMMTMTMKISFLCWWVGETEGLRYFRLISWKHLNICSKHCYGQNSDENITCGKCGWRIKVMLLRGIKWDLQTWSNLIAGNVVANYQTYTAMRVLVWGGGLRGEGGVSMKMTVITKPFKVEGGSLQILIFLGKSISRILRCFWTRKIGKGQKSFWDQLETRHFFERFLPTTKQKQFLQEYVWLGNPPHSVIIGGHVIGKSCLSIPILQQN